MAARRKTAAQANAPHSAPHTPSSPPPAPSAAPPADSPAAAVRAALTANPGATAAQIADAAGTSRIIAGRELAALEASGLATRTPGARKGRTTAPATWQPAPQPPAPAPSGPDEAPAASPADTTASPAPAAGDGRLPAPGSAPEEAGGNAPGTDHADPGKAARAPADGGTPGEHAGPPAAGAPDAGAADAPATTDSAPAGGEPQPAAAGEAAALLRDLASAATSAAEALDGGDTAAALAVMDAIRDGAAQARRLLKAAAAVRKPRGTSPAARPGQLRDLVAAHLAANPAAEFTPHAIGRVLGRSSGAVANALDRLTALGQARLTTDRPRRYQHQAPESSTPAPAGTT